MLSFSSLLVLSTTRYLKLIEYTVCSNKAAPSTQSQSTCIITLLQIVDTLLPLSNLEARVNSAVDLITSAHKNINLDSLRFAATTFYYKLKAADDYVPTTKYHGNVMLIRAKTSSQYEENLGADYKLGEVGSYTTTSYFSNKKIPGISPVILKN